ncbi:hypothetical protein AQ490_09020 [Wenjunlia vitaminophila]|uniref:Uncharacterized protein n=1 Tax=Wenjunlia vitaminophila TaxID=76728 RepID=A0A0T6LLE8_WENVI|nr:DUF6716 putative glycosyltransferase [Wenjunlia vitaminophila]KRV46909.1 hypothetical protein AQ490_09020 [Wenjunlia vitaminophila]
MPASPPSPTAQHARVLVLADSDTRWKWGALIARQLAPGAELHGRLLRGRATPTVRQLREVGVDPASLDEVTTARFLHELGPGSGPRPDVVVLSLVGGAVQAVLHGLGRVWHGQEQRPVVVTGYVGVVYEKLTDGLLLRAGADLVLANGAHDAQRFRAVYAGVGLDPDAVVETSLPFLGGQPYAPGDDRPFTVTFAVQPSVPGDPRDRMYLLRRAADHARRHPDRDVLVKLRSKPGEHTTHLEESPYQKLVRRLADRPDNLRLVYGNMGDVLDRTDLMVTVSSTAALESMHRGVPTAVLADLGVREALGNHHFLGSGCLTSWDRLDQGHVPRADPDWLARHGVTPGTDPFAAARERVRLVAGTRPAPALRTYYTPAVAGGYLPGLLARYGLDPTGGPLRDQPATTAPADPGPVRRAVRGGARWAYRSGVQRVAPLIRRVGEL